MRCLVSTHLSLFSPARFARPKFWCASFRRALPSPRKSTRSPNPPRVTGDADAAAAADNDDDDDEEEDEEDEEDDDEGAGGTGNVRI